MQVCFVSLPFQNIENPALSLSLLKSILNQKGITSKVIYANMKYAEQIGMITYYAIARGGICREALMGDFVFSKAAFGHINNNYYNFLTKEFKPYFDDVTIQNMLAYIKQAEEATESFIDNTVNQVLQEQPKIVACSSITQQNCASLSFLRKIKEKCPQCITIMGGPNCERIMGKTIAENFPWVDYVISGEADSFWADFCQKLLNGQRYFPEYPFIFTYAGQNDSAAAGITTDLSQIPYPDFDDYFDALENFKYQKSVQPGLLIETSRGCWWGEKHPCIFCGMTGGSKQFRAKNYQQVINEFHWLSDKYKIKNFFVVDCILAQDFFKTVIPALKDLNLLLMYEIKTNTTVSQLKILKDSGVSWVQPGIESLQDDLLKLMNKGNRAIKHVELLKNLSEIGIRACWLLLCDFPNDNDSWYEQQLEVLQQITHLQPPDAVFRLRFDRFSTYEQNQSQYRLHLMAGPAYTYIYPTLEQTKLKDLAYFLTDEYNPRPIYGQGFVKEIHHILYSFVNQWQASYNSPLRDRLTVKKVENHLEVLDLRHCAKQFLYELSGCEAELAWTARNVIKETELIAILKQKYTSEVINKAINSLLDKKLLLKIDTEILFLPLTQELSLPDKNQLPAGNILLNHFSEDI